MKIADILSEALTYSPAEYAPMVRQAVSAPPSPTNPYDGLSAAASEFETNQQTVTPDGIAGTEMTPAAPPAPAAPMPASVGPTPNGFPAAAQPMAAPMAEAMTWADYLALCGADA